MFGIGFGGKNMYAVIKTGGKQYKVEEGCEIRIEKIEGKRGDEVVFDDVLLVSDEGSLHVGEAVKAKVTGTVVIEAGEVKENGRVLGRHKKIIVFKQRRRKRYRRTKGHRQYFTAVKITGITLN